MSVTPLPSVPGWPAVFRGSDAVRAGLLSKGWLRGPGYDRLFPDVYAPATGAAPDLALRSVGAYLWGRGRGAASGWSAAELLGASCGPRAAPASLTVPGSDLRPPRGLDLHRDHLRRAEVTRRGPVAVTTPVRTAFDLARWIDDPVEAVVALDALARTGAFNPTEVLDLAARYPRARRRRRVAALVARADGRSGSPMESRLRLTLVDGGLPVPQVQYPVQDPDRRTAVWLDLAYPELRIGIEYEGEDHTRPERVLRDVSRYTNLVDAGWRVYRFTKYEILGEPDQVVAKIRRARETALSALRA